ncbi:unannotated protein [freshwater metagenome]|uniref:Unannotated protein n=1 Tax=freshwater metagenome TaxID=449393 RepID=A0A6J6S6I6_9ZZZZ
MAFELANHALVHGDEIGRARAGIAEHDILRIVVVQNLLADDLGHLGEERISVRQRHGVGSDEFVEQDLDVHFMVGRVNAGRVVDGIGVEANPGSRRLDPAELRQSQIAALANDPASQVVAIDPDRVIALIAHFCICLRSRLDVGADASVP